MAGDCLSDWTVLSFLAQFPFSTQDLQRLMWNSPNKKDASGSYCVQLLASRLKPSSMLSAKCSYRIGRNAPVTIDSRTVVLVVPQLTFFARFVSFDLSITAPVAQRMIR